MSDEPNSPIVIDEWTEYPEDFDWSKLKSIGPNKGFITACTDPNNIPKVWPKYRSIDKGTNNPPVVAIWDGEKYTFEKYTYIPPPPPMRYRRFKNRIRKAFWFLFRDEE